MGLVVAKKKAADRASLPTTHPCFFHLFFLLIIHQPEVRDPKPQFFVGDLVSEPGQGHAQLFGDMKFSEKAVFPF